MPKWTSVTRQGFYGAERCGIVRDPEAMVGLHYAPRGMEVPHSWSIWPDDPPRYKVCMRCHQTRTLTDAEVTAYQIARGRMDPPVAPAKPKRKRTTATKKQTERQEENPERGE